MKYTLLLALILSSSAHAQTCAGPAPCDYQPEQPIGPYELCLPEGCVPVSYQWDDRFMTAASTLPNGYPVRGVAGPCLTDYCPNISIQAFNKLLSNALDADRAQRFGE